MKWLALPTKVGCLFMFMGPRMKKGRTILLNLQRVVDGTTFNNLTKIIVKSLMEYGSLNEKKIANKLVYFGANDVTIFQGAKIGVIT